MGPAAPMGAVGRYNRWWKEGVSMNSESSRRNFLAAGLALPAAGLAKPTATPLPAQASAQKAPEKVKLTYRTLGKTGLKVTSLSFGCMTASDPSVIARAADLGIIHFDSARGYQSGNNERMLGGAIKGKRQQLVISSKSIGKTPQGDSGRPGYQPERTGHRLPGHLVPAQPEHAGRGAGRAVRSPAKRQEGREDPVRRRQHALQHGQNAGVPGQEGADRRGPHHLQLRHAERDPGQ